MTGAPPGLSVAGLNADLGGRRVLQGIDLAVRPGTLTVIVGPNGSGKTTLMRALTGELAAEGRIALDGADIRRLPPALLAARRAVLPQATPLAFPFRVAEVVRMGAEAGLAGHAGAGPLVARMLAAVDLPGYGPRLYQQLSGGEQQRVQLARVLAQVAEPVAEGGDARWLFLDEPVSSLDIAHQLMVLRLARGFAQRGGGVVAVLHDLNLTAAFADRVVLLKGGCLIAQGGPDAVLTEGILSAAYDCALQVVTLADGRRLVLPAAAA